MQAFKGWIPVTVNFMCQTGWARCPDIGSNVILNVSVKVFCFVFFCDVNILSWLSTLLCIVCVGFIQSIDGLNRTMTDLPCARRNPASRLPLGSNFNSSLSLQLTSLPYQILDLPVSTIMHDLPKSKGPTQTHERDWLVSEQQCHYFVF